MHWKLQSTSKRLFLGRVISPPECTQPKKNFFEEFCTKVNIYSLYDLEPKMRKCPEQLWQFRNYGLAQVSLSISVPFESVILFLSLCIQHQSGKHVSAKKSDERFVSCERRLLPRRWQIRISRAFTGAGVALQVLLNCKPGHCDEIDDRSKLVKR